MTTLDDIADLDRRTREDPRLLGELSLEQLNALIEYNRRPPERVSDSGTVTSNLERRPMPDRGPEAPVGAGTVTALVDEQFAPMETTPRPLAPEGMTAAQEQAEADAARTAAAERQRSAVMGRAREPGKPEETVPVSELVRGAVRAAGAVGQQAREVPLQIVGGARDAAQAALNGYYAVGRWLNELGIPTLGAAAAVTAALMSRTQPVADQVRLPDVKQPKTATGAVTREVAQFLAGFAAAGPIVRGLGVAGAVSRPMVQGVVADFAGFDAHEERLANLIQQVPELANPVAEFMMAKEGEGELEGRLKRAAEGAGLGLLTEGLIRALKYMKAARAIRDEVDPDRALARELAKPQEAQPLGLLGDETAPAFQVGALSKAKGAMGRTLDLGVPDDVAARALTPQGLTPLAEGVKNGGVYVNFARIDTADDVKRVIADTANAFKSDIDAARRGVQSHAQTIEAAGGVEAWEALLKRRAGAPLNAEESLAARRLWEASAAKLLDVANAAAKNPTPENLFQFRKLLAIHHTIQREVIAARTETARALQQWRIPAGGTGAEKLMAIANALGSSGGEEAAVLLAQRVAALKNIPGGIGMLEDIAEKSWQATTVNAIKEIWVNALLSNPKTHVVNMMGNSAALLNNLAERWAAAGYSQLIGSGEIAAGEAAAQLFALGQATREALRLFGQALKTGESAFGMQTTKVGDAGYARAIAAEGDDLMAKGVNALGAIINLPTRFLTAEDDFFKAIGYRTELAARAFRQARQELQAGKITAEGLNARIAELMAANPPKDLHMAAIDAAAYATFTQKAGPLVSAINRLERLGMESGSGGGYLGSLGLKLTVPFRNTPANLMKYAFERTPLAPLMREYREAIARGGADADLARTRMVLGSMVLTAMMDLAFDGVITGSGPPWRESGERGTRDTMTRSGWQPYSIRIGDRYWSYRRTDPIGLTLGLAADIAQIITNAELDAEDRDAVYGLAAAAVMSFAGQVLDRAYMQGLSDVIDLTHNPDRAQRFVDRTAGSLLIPNLVKGLREVEDPYIRAAHDMTTELMNRIPGLSKDLPVARDMWGRPRSYQSGLGTVYDAVSPIAVRTWQPEPIDREALKHDFNLMMPPYALRAGGETVPLRQRPEVYHRYLELRGQTKPSELGVSAEAEPREGARGRRRPAAPTLIEKYGDLPLLELLNQIVSGKHKLSAEYEKASGGRNGGKDRMITRIVADYGRVAAAKVLEEFPDLKPRAARGRAILPRDVFEEPDPGN